MRIKVQVVVEDAETTVTEEITSLQRKELSPETLGLTLEEGKKVLSNLQKIVASSQINEYISQYHLCPACGSRQSIKDVSGKITFRTVFGKLMISNPRF